MPAGRLLAFVDGCAPVTQAALLVPLPHAVVPELCPRRETPDGPSSEHCPSTASKL